MASIITRSGVINYAAFSSSFEKREILRKYIDVVDDAMGYFDWMDFTGRAVPTGNVSYDNITESSLFSTMEVKTTAIAGSADTNSAIVVLAANAVPFVGETVLFPDHSTALVYSLADSSGDWSVTLTPIGAGNNIPAVTDGDQIVLLGNAQGEGGELTGTLRRPTSTKRSNNVQLFTTKTSITDVAGSTVIEIPFNGSSYRFNKDKYQHHLNHRMQIASTFLTQAGGSATNAAGETVWFTKGLRPQVVDAGFGFTTAGSGVFDLVVDQKTQSIAMDAARCGSEYMLLAGQTLDLAMDTNSLTNTAFTGGGISYAAYGGKDRIAIAMGAKSITFGGYTIHKQRFKPAEHPQLLGATGYSLAKREGYLIPTDKVKVKDGGAIDRMRTRYMTFNGDKDLRYREVETGALASTPTNAKRELGYSVLSTQGLEIAGIEQFGLVTLKA